MKPSRTTLLLITSDRIVRADFDGGPPTFKSARRPAGSFGVSVAAALALGSKASTVWVLNEELFEHRLMLSPAQVAGLSAAQLGRALSFEVEPFSGIPVADGITGFHRGGDGSFDVIEVTRTDLEATLRAVKAAGGKFAGLAYAGLAPADDSLEPWLAGWMLRLLGGALPVITPPPPAPSQNRFAVVAVVLTIAALVIIGLDAGWMALQRNDLEAQNAAFTAASRQLDEANAQTSALKKELADLAKEQGLRVRLSARRTALLALLNSLAATRSQDVVIRSILAEGSSSLVISGLSLEAGAVDEMSIVLTQSLRSAGWSAQPRSKTGSRRLPSGGPWEFSLVVSHEENTTPAKNIQVSQRRSK